MDSRAEHPIDLESLSEARRRLRRAGIASDAAGALHFEQVADAHEMAWETPRVASDLPGFVSSLLGAMGEQERFILLPRGGAPWLAGTEYDQGPIVEQLRDRIVATLPVPPDFAGTLSFAKSEWRDVMMVVLTFLVYGWCSSDDLHVLPGDLSFILLTSHHGSVRVAGRSAESIDRFTRAMARDRFYAVGFNDEDAFV